MLNVASGLVMAALVAGAFKARGDRRRFPEDAPLPEGSIS
jgi:hypothetical protein